MKIKVALVGSGQRVVEGLWPALHCLAETHEIVEVYARREKRISCGAGLELTVTAAFTASIERADIIAIAVPPVAVAEVLHLLSRYDTSNAILMLDTPVLPIHLLAIARHRFAKCLVLEDCIALPAICAARELIANGRIGALQRVYFHHNGYRYHAVASLRALTRKRGVGWVRSRQYSTARGERVFGLGERMKAVVYEPRDYESGRLLIEGTKGRIGDYDLGARSHIRLDYLKRDDGAYAGLSVDGVIASMNELDELYLRRLPRGARGRNLMRSMKVRALMDILIGATQRHSEYRCSAWDALWDNAIVVASDTFGLAFDPRL